MEEQHNNQHQTLYRYNTKYIGSLIGLGLLTMVTVVGVIGEISRSQNKFYDARTHEIVTPGFSSSSLIMEIVMLIVEIVIIAFLIKNLKVYYYEIVCPHCKQITYFEVDATNTNCEKCGEIIYYSQINGTTTTDTATRTEPHCKQCGEPLTDKDVFCSKCGTKNN